MVQLGYLEIAYNEHNHFKITQAGSDVLFGKSMAQLVVIQREEPKPKRKRKAEVSSLLPLSDRASISIPKKAINYDELFELLRNLRREIASEEMVPPYIVFSDKTLQQLALLHPTSIEAFGNVNGVGEYKKRKYGERFTSLIRRALKE